MSRKNQDIQTQLTKGLLDIIILQLLKTHPMYGYEIITKIRKSFGVYFGPSTIYPRLNAMEKKNHIKSEWDMNSDRAKKIYELTKDGKAMLDSTSSSLKAICKTMGTDNTETPNTSSKQN